MLTNHMKIQLKFHCNQEKELPESVTCLYFRSNMCLSLFVLFTDMFVLLDLYVPLIQYLGWWRNCWCLI
ncbi:hypothetical protein EB796_013115 [Bugula neritina]|uniref:Uncharacterized protein n=1 Tax=Bugula neritina TaxID=10212 RepID=A0A7J7JSY0_BUGNE|nr:hypothetical protein EB796_013115 [Bugula neritina]